ncbi:MAG: iron-sulfur cluster assembly scaffold protein [Planctomycetota bacterium]|nr:iron-sulfur cluster assembly scaffold protein [Planctomycetota bacterium]
MNPLEDHAWKPRNLGVLEGADLHIQVENPVCGDILHLYVKRTAGRVVSSTFQVFGCPAAIAAASVLTEALAGKGPAELRELTAREIDEALGGLPAGKAHAAELAVSAVSRVLGEWKAEA